MFVPLKQCSDTSLITVRTKPVEVDVHRISNADVAGFYDSSSARFVTIKTRKIHATCLVERVLLRINETCLRQL